MTNVISVRVFVSRCLRDALAYSRCTKSLIFSADAHLKNLILHHEIIASISGGRLDFSPWQQIYYAEFDGQRKKRVVVKVMGV